MNMKREPVAIVSAIIAVIETLIALLVAFGLKLTGEQVGAIMAFVTAVGGLISILIVRPRVTPVADPRDNEGRRLVPAPQ
jgi:uncharacterized membrane protein YkgB